MAAPAHVLPPQAGPVLLAAMAFFALYLAYEIWRWASGNRAQLTIGQLRRRLFTGGLLEVDLLLWFFANTFMAAMEATGLRRGKIIGYELLYLLAATLLVFIAMLMAVREAAFVMHQYARWRGEVVRNLAKPETGESGGS